MPINSFLYPGAKVPPPYEVANSLRFDDDSSHSLTRTFGSGDQKTWTWSAWVKKTANLTTLGNFDFVLFNGYQDTNNRLSIFYSQTQADGSVDDCLKIFGTASGSTSVNAFTSALYRDNSAWYHVVCAFDTTQATGSNRIKIYVNGVQQTLTFGTTPAQDSNQSINFNQNHTIGNYNTNTASTEFDGYMAEVVFVDGTALDPTSFGEFDEDTGIWKPINVSGLTFGTNGFYLDFENSSSLGADVSGNGNNFTVNNLTSVDQSTDTCTNNFCTMNPLYSYTGITFSEGNLQTNLGGSNHRWGTGTFFVESGKWYFECKVLSDNNANSGPGVIAYGIDDPLTTEGGGAGSKAEGWIYLSTSAGDLQHGGTQYGTASAATTNDILMVAFDVDNGKIWIGKNGTWSEGSNPSTGNGAVREDLGDASSGLFTPGISGYNENFVFNFGSPPFSISSGNADANGYGNFEYAVPSGFYSLCTKNLAEYG